MTDQHETKSPSLFTVSLPQVQQYARIALYHIGTFAMSHGVMVSDNSKTLISGVILNLITLSWTIYATRAAGRINDLVGMNVVDVIVTKDTKLADSIPSNKVQAASDVTVIKK